ncbi:hypothetical protein MPSEU_000454500 [Mayamaea pseudoterrestris]|nr:hypothetical protein MPSEU_000454500 [Mayamaea pseudoterrestris]
MQSSYTESSLDVSIRRDLLHTNLESIDINANELNDAAIQSMTNPTNGYDGRYGKSAIKTYRAFLYPKTKSDPALTMDSTKLQAAARRTSLQIQFLLARHKSHQAEWVRHHDLTDPTDDASSSSSTSKFPLMLLLDNLRSAQNVGSLFRTADAAGLDQVVTCGITPHPNGSGADKLRKTALGADAIVDSIHFETTKRGIAYVRESKPDYAIIGMETTEQSTVYTDYDFSSHAGVCLVLGNEVTGVNAELMPSFDAILEIPMFGVKNSLNVAACAPIMLYEIIRQWSLSKTE